VLTPVTRHAETASPAAFRRYGAKRFAIEEAPHELPRARRNHHRIRLSNRLQSGRKLDRFTQQPVLIGPVADEIAADDRAAADANAQLQLRAAARVSPGDSLDQGETSMDGLGVEFVCLGISKADQHFVR
jgi:hypothetical protein